KASSDNEYRGLSERFPLRPIRSDRELKRAISIIDELITRDKRSRDADDYLRVLANLVKEYEDEHYAIPDVTEAEMLAHLIEARGITQRVLADATRLRESAISDLLAGRRKFNRNHIERFSRYFHVSPAGFFPN